ncbi:MAG: diaminopimelate epimerase [Saccharofermentans sp.]|nr:diaminopimelate epimerase [Saccharofermentans sp.]
MATIDFTKMHGIGNDYIYINCLENMVEDPTNLAIKMSDRHFGVGGDGIVLIAPSSVADARMIMFNMDGSEGNMCGNAIRCVGKYMYDRVGLKKNPMTIETKSGIKILEFNAPNGIVETVKVNMGATILEPEKIPVTLAGDENNQVVNREVEIDGKKYGITAVSMGNPHAVTYLESEEAVDNLEIEKIGPKFENNPIFPERVNTEFVSIIDDHTLKMRVWERGSGETWACGTGACATVVSSVLNGYCPKGEDIKVKLRGGDLVIRYTDEAVFMTGSATFVFDGVMEV